MEKLHRMAVAELRMKNLSSYLWMRKYNEDIQNIANFSNGEKHYTKNVTHFLFKFLKNLPQILQENFAKLAIIEWNCEHKIGYCVETRSRIHVRTIRLRFLGIILRVLIVEVSVYNVYITNLRPNSWTLLGKKVPSLLFTVTSAKEFYPPPEQKWQKWFESGL